MISIFKRQCPHCNTSYGRSNTFCPSCGKSHKQKVKNSLNEPLPYGIYNITEKPNGKFKISRKNDKHQNIAYTVDEHGKITSKSVTRIAPDGPADELVAFMWSFLKGIIKIIFIFIMIQITFKMALHALEIINEYTDVYEKTDASQEEIQGIIDNIYVEDSNK